MSMSTSMTTNMSIMSIVTNMTIIMSMSIIIMTTMTTASHIMVENVPVTIITTTIIMVRVRQRSMA